MSKARVEFMKPVALLQHDAMHRPGFLLECLEANGIAARTFQASDEDLSALDATDFSGLVVLGSRCSANDNVPWIERELDLIGDALAHDVPVLGHSFGGHLLARSMGAQVWKAGGPTIGWSALHVTPCGKPLFADAPRVMAFNWHRETFTIPRGATRTLFGQYALNEGYVHGRHLAFQCHLELTEQMVVDWCRIGASELRQADGCAVQRANEILAKMPGCLPMLQHAAQTVYRHWIAGLERPRFERVAMGASEPR